ncbi:hypothetical protein GYMLUDRAFT_42527 [Collybiopsis luxurians FD-317 M1]|uniref:Uncharacterized protein n=1 Tax=Collybiopsis luxurians FD-317 M1 TaxID=944289 RepID=A0A0D0BEA3_9AGAR|nr:hypothetical protein GYMLUDRAFT_42527 [Collybiopsis luxurians FD-317 M1]
MISACFQFLSNVLYLAVLIGTSLPLTPGVPGSGTSPNPIPGGISSLPITSGPFLARSHLLSIDNIPSTFPVPSSSTVIPTRFRGGFGNTSTATEGRRPMPKGSRCCGGGAPIFERAIIVDLVDSCICTEDSLI